MSYIPRLKEKFLGEITPALMEEFSYKNTNEVPRLLKISLNQGVGDAIADKKIIETAVEEMSLVAGQKAVTTKSRKDISNFKLRRGMPIGARVTLRGNRMYEFLDRLVAVSLPRIRDFKGINEKGFDGRGNFSLGVTEQIIFPEIQIDKVTKIRGMDITFVTSAKTDKEAFALLREFGIPFKNRKIKPTE
jgi:large subunit ribosomal protein L5